MTLASALRNFLVLGLIAPGLAGCYGGETEVGLPTIDPPTIDMGPVPDRLTKVTVRNGAGDVIFDGTPARFKETTVQPGHGTFDGTLEIEWKTRKGESGTQTLTHDPEKSIDLDFDWDDHTFSLTEKRRIVTPSTGIGFNAFGGYLERSLGATGAFTDISGGEKALVEVDKMDGFRVGATLNYRLFGPTRVGTPGLGFNADALDLSLAIEYTKLDGASSRFVAPGEGDTGITFPRMIDGSTGFDFGDTGADARMESRFEGVSVRLGDRKVWVEDDQGGHWEYQFQPSAFFSYGRYETDARIRNATFPDIFGRDETDLDEWRLGLGFGGRVQYHTPRIAPFIGGSVELYHRWADLDGVQQTMGGGFLTPAQEEPIPYSDSDSGLGARLTGEIGIESEIANRLTVGLKGFLSYDTSTSYVDKRDNPAEDETAIATDDAFDYGIVAGLQLKF